MENELDLTIKKLSKLLDLHDLPQDTGAAICLANDLDLLLKARGIIKHYRDE
jgi:hypothetical protein